MVSTTDPHDPFADLPALLSVKQTARYLQSSQDYVRRLVREGELPAARVGRSYLIAAADLRAWLESRKVQLAGDRSLTRAQLQEAKRVNP